MDRTKIQKTLYIALFAALMAVSAWISVPTPIPFTLQTFTFFLALMVIGGASSAIMSMVYLSLGIVGLPVFASFGSGAGYLLGASGGFILGFPVAALFFTILCRIFGMGKVRKLIFSVAALILIYLLGTLWFGYVYAKNTDFFAALTVCTLPYIIPDAVKIFLAYCISDRLNFFRK